MIGSFLGKMRRKPKHVRDNIAFGSAAFVTLAIFTVWLVNDPLHSGDISATTDEPSPKAFATFFGQIKDQFASAKAALPKVETNNQDEATLTATTTFVNTLRDTATTSPSDWSLASSSLRAQVTPKEVAIMVVTSSSTESTTTSPAASY